jgi:hypothetical protein
VPDLLTALNDDSGSPSQYSVLFLKALLDAKEPNSKLGPVEVPRSQAAYFAAANALVEIDPEAARKVLAP